MTLPSVASHRSGSRIESLVVFLCAIVLYSINLDRPPHPDELHHVLAAQHLLETGHPLIGQGEYSRGILHTWLVAISYEVFGEGLASARVPAVLFVALVAVILFVWVRHEAGRLAGWLTAALFISSPFSVEIAQFSRFYALQMFFFLLGALCAYYASASAAAVRRRALLGALALALMLLATWLQDTSLMGVAGVAAWGIGVLGLHALAGTATNRARLMGLVTVLVIAAVVIVVVAIQTDILGGMWRKYQQTPLFNAGTRHEFWFYYVRFFIFYPTLWPFVGVLAVFAAVQSPRLAWFALTVFSISFLIASFGGSKATRYLSFAQPYLAIVWGVGLAGIVPPLRRFVGATRIRFAETLALPQRHKSRVGTALLVIAAAMVVLTNPFWLRTATVIGNVTLPFDKPATDWRAAREALAWWTSNADIMITTEELGAIYFLGRSDVRYSPSKLGELPRDQQFEFGIDPRTGRPVISEPESLERLIECFPSGLVVGPIEHWGSPILISEAVQAILARHARPIEVPKDSHLYAWGWVREPHEARLDYCSHLSRLSGRRLR